MLYVGVAFVWGIPAIAGLAELTPEDGPPLLTGFTYMALALTFFLYVILAQLFVYFGLLYWLPRRRPLAILLSPLAVGILFVFAQGPLEAVIVVLAGVSYGASVWFPHGPRAWWEREPRLVAVAAAVWLATTIAIALIQPLPAGLRTDVAVTIHERGQTVRYRLACEYDRAGRVRRAVRVPHAHPGGAEACQVLDEASRSLADGPPYLQDGCLAGPAAIVRGRVRGRPFNERIVAGDCDETAFELGEVNVLFPLR